MKKINEFTDDELREMLGAIHAVETPANLDTLALMGSLPQTMLDACADLRGELNVGWRVRRRMRGGRWY